MKSKLVIRCLRLGSVILGSLVLVFTAFGQNAGQTKQTTSIFHVLTERDKPRCEMSNDNSSSSTTYIPMDSWMYPALDRLQALGYIDSAFMGIRPWTRLSVLHALDCSKDALHPLPGDEVATEIYLAVREELRAKSPQGSTLLHPYSEIESVYARVGIIAGTPLRDGFHLGQTLVNDYGRPYQRGFNLIAGTSAVSQAGRLSLYVRGEFQEAPAAAGYSPILARTLSNIDGIDFVLNPKQTTIPQGPIPSTSNFRLLEASLSYRVLNHEISIGKNDHWLGPAKGGSFAWSNNAENIYAFQIDRVEPLRVPWLSAVTGPFRYLFLVGSLKGHAVPNSPWIHLEKISFKPTVNLEMGFERATIWGGEGHAPITFHSFVHSFFSFQNVPFDEKISRNDPGARFGTFDFSYRLPYLRHWLTLYTDSLVHDDVSPVDAPRHAGIRPGIYLSHFPHAHLLDLRVEAASTDPPTGRSAGGNYLYTEYIQRQGYTNQGMILGDAIGRESKGGQLWLTYHPSPTEQIQFSYRNAKAASDFIPGGTTQNVFQAYVVKRVHRTVEFRVSLSDEQWRAPIYAAGRRNDASASLQITFYPPNAWHTENR